MELTVGVDGDVPDSSCFSVVENSSSNIPGLDAINNCGRICPLTNSLKPAVNIPGKDRQYLEIEK